MENTLNLGPIQKFITDPAISQVMINGPKKVFIEKDGKKFLTEVTFADETEVAKLVEAIYGARGKRVDKDVPYADVCLEDGTRINTIISPVSRFGITVTFRKFSQEITTLDDLLRVGTLSKKVADFLVACVKGKINILFSGGTGVGKTTALQILSSFFDPQERVVTIEDAAELHLSQANVISLETRTPDREGRGEVTLRDLIRNALRMAPDRLVIGEIRGAEALDMIQAMATGHSGTLGIMHGNSPRQVIARLETMILMSGINLSLLEVRRLITSTVQMVVHMERLQDGSRKVTYLTEIRGLDGQEIVFNDLFTFNLERIDERGKVVGNLRSSIRYYPLFFKKLQRQNLISDKAFVNE